MNKQQLIKDIKTKISNFQAQKDVSENNMVKYRKNSLGYITNSENVIRYHTHIITLNWVLGELEQIQ
jgi:hypothetical protein